MNKILTKKHFTLAALFSLTMLVSAVVYAAKINPPATMPDWTYGCWNCYNSFPWLRGVEEKFADQDFTVIGIHTPEFEREKDPKNVAERIEHFELHHPVMMDNDKAYWYALRNRYWPAYYIVDKKGNIRDAFIGETHEGDRRAKKIEKVIAKLLKE